MRMYLAIFLIISPIHPG